ncbi:MAG: DUF3837 domain-containing protein [Lachnospiraceae bacterium]|uniref:DUF3837 domain-containing protein n=1 Tax=Candidatus Weimeria bifida TaxID=2599074 RepID=A0A6N7IY29_9FIRM|nr:DUF3837 domain-containing protein [Candidatus Weimeria bifida]RRF97263.1 MAG: DUF3837 domain-containing protein [Lachnospiraceae bacterium]
MIELLARQSVDRKVCDHASVIVGNYEYYYACGLLDRRLSLGFPADLKPADLYQKMQDVLSDVPVEAPAGDDTTDEDYLKYLVKRYEPDDKFDKQMTELFTFNG